jgi:hypothetical protein
MKSRPPKSFKSIRWLISITVLALIILACNLSVDLYPTATPAPTNPPPPAPQENLGPTPFPTHTPYPTYTLVIPSLAPVSTNTPIPTIMLLTATQTKGAKPAYTEIKKDSASFACGGNPSKVTISAIISNPDDVYYVTLFYKLTDKATNKQTDYQTENLNFKGGNTWSLTLPATSVANPNHWSDTWLTYQMVLQVKETKELIRSDYFTDISFKPCP